MGGGGAVHATRGGFIIFLYSTINNININNNITLTTLTTSIINNINYITNTFNRNTSNTNNINYQTTLTTLNIPLQKSSNFDVSHALLATEELDGLEETLGSLDLTVGGGGGAIL